MGGGFCALFLLLLVGEEVGMGGGWVGGGGRGGDHVLCFKIHCDESLRQK